MHAVKIMIKLAFIDEALELLKSLTCIKISLIVIFVFKDFLRDSTSSFHLHMQRNFTKAIFLMVLVHEKTSKAVAMAQW